MQFDTSRTAEYEKIYNEFRWNIPEKFNFGFDVVDKWAADRTKLALLSLDESGDQADFMSFYQLSTESNRLPTR